MDTRDAPALGIESPLLQLCNTRWLCNWAADVRLLRHTAFSREDRTSRWTPTAGGCVPTLSRWLLRCRSFSREEAVAVEAALETRQRAAEQVGYILEIAQGVQP